MRSKDLSTVRFSGLAPDTHAENIREFLARNKLSVIGGISLYPCRTTEDTHLVGTVTFSSPSEAKKALDLDGQTLGNSSIHIEREFMGFTVLAAPKEPSVDIIAVHGLNGHAYGTWAVPSEAKGSVEAMWLRDFLPSQVSSARVLVYGYNSSLFGTQTSVSSVKDFATDLLQRIVDDRVTAEDIRRPIIFICHSLGGLVIKQALVIAHNDNRRYGRVFAASRFLMFFGTPHKGSRAAGITLPFANIAALAFQRPPKQLLQTLKTDSPTLSELLAKFNLIRGSFTIVSLYERRMTTILNALIKRCLENIEKGVLNKNVSANRQSQIQVDNPPKIERQGIFLVPTSPNQYFEGRKLELERLEVLLNTRKQFGLSSHCPIVAVHGLGGIGKTQLATQYVYNRKAQKPHTCTFWISARSKEELRSGLESVLHKLALDPAHFVGSRTVEPGLSLLKMWMTLPESGDWLLVLDNYDEIEVKLNEFVPAEAVGSVLITSRDRKIIGSVANSGLSLAAMNEVDAKHLFLRLSSPTANSVSDALQPFEDVEALNDTLQELQYFPLAIDQAASFIRENSPMTVREYLDYLKPRSLDRERLLRFKQARPEYPESVMTTWEISLAYLNKINPRASWILQLLGFLDNNSIPENLLLLSVKDHPMGTYLCFDLGPRHLPESVQTKLAYLQNDVGFREAIGTLTSLSLIQRNAKSRDLSVHPLVHEWIRVRLNIAPETQANWTIVVAWILFQTFPCERYITSLSSWETKNVGHHLLSVGKHLESLLENLQDYMEYLEELPIECYILYETLFLAASSDLSSFDLVSNVLFQPFSRLHENLDHTIQSILTRLPPQYTSIAKFIHRLITWVAKKPSRGCIKTKQEMTDVLADLRITCPLESSNILFLMLLTKAVVQVSRYVDDVDSQKINLHARRAGAERKHKKKTSQRDKSNSQLFLKLRDLLEFAQNGQEAPLIYELTNLMVKKRLMDWISSEGFAKCDFLHPSKLLSLDHLDYLSLSETGEYICRLAQLLWDHEGPKDYEGIKLLFSVAYRHWKVLLAKEHLRAVEEAAKQAAELSTVYQTTSSYISSSFGRSIAPEKLYAMDLETPLAYIWITTKSVAIEIANANARWTTHERLQCQTESSTFALDLPERKSAENVFLRMKQLHSKIVTLGHSSKAKDVNLELMMAFGPDDCDSTLTQIYVATTQWHKAQPLVLRWLQCTSITEYCNSCNQKGSFPWLEKRNPNPAKIVKNMTVPSSKKDGQPSGEMQTYDLRGRRQLGTLAVPDSCNCILNIEAGNMITAFLALAGAQNRLSAETKLAFERKLEHLQINAGSDESCLGRLEIIYKVAQNYPEVVDPPTAKPATAMDIVGRHNNDGWAGEAMETSSSSLSESGSSDSEDRALDGEDQALDSYATSSKEELDFEW